MQIEITRNEFIKKFNGLEKQAKAEILLQAGLSQERISELGDLKDVEVSDISECFDNDLVCTIWNIMEGIE